MTIELRNYQKKCIEKIKWSLSLDDQINDLIQLPTGSGKSVVIAELANYLDRDVLILQPSLEILKQNRNKLSLYVDKKSISAYSASANEKVISKYTFATIGSIYTSPELFAHFSIFIIDECFISGTKVSGKNIEDIKVGDKVRSYNHKTNQIEWKRVLAVSKKWQRNSLTNLGNGYIISTHNHPIYNYDKKQYIEASKITEQDKVIISESELSEMQQRYNDRDEYIRRKYLEISKVLLQKVWNSILFKKLFLQTQWRKKFYENEKVQSNGQNRNKKEDVCNTKKNWTQAKDTRGEWTKYDNPTVKVIKKTWEWMVSRVSNNNRKWLQAISLQNRYSQSYKKNSNRNKWKLSLFKKSNSGRYTKKEVFRTTKLGSFSLYQPRDTRKLNKGCWVYNIEVEDNNNYFANGILVHNCHLLNPKDTGSMFKSFIDNVNEIRRSQGLDKVKVIGFTATPYRIFPTYFFRVKGDYNTMYQSNSIKVLTRVIAKKGDKPFWGRMLFNVNNDELFREKYLCPLEYVDKSTITQDMIPINKSGTDFDMAKYDKAVKGRDTEVIQLIQEASNRHKHILVFCNSLSQSERLQKHFSGSLFNCNSVSVSSESSAKEREKAISDFVSGEVKIMFNVGVLTTGFDFPELDCIVLLRPTRSVSLYYQMLGRGLRIHPSKERCTVYDWTDTVKRIGKIETIKLEKVDDKWNVTTETKPEGWHGVLLYTFELK